MEEVLNDLKRFHGHLGPYVVIGYRMGQLANKHLGNGAFSKYAEVWTGTTPPVSCIIDGIQMSSGCTLGKGTINVVDQNLPKARFVNKKGDALEITLKETIHRHIDQELEQDHIEQYAKTLYELPDEDLFLFK